MKMIAKTTFGLLVILGIFLSMATVSMAQVTLTVSPSVVSNTYPGLVTFNITGLTNGEKVLIAKWLDLNGNNAIDPGEPLVDQFKLIDNANGYALIGGVTNINVPVDINPDSGAITASINMPAAMILENCIGHYVYQVISPTGRFAPVSAIFAVTNAPLSQSASGTVYQSDGVTPFPNAVVVVQDQVNNNTASAVVADGSGHYSILLYPGEYQMIVAMPNYYAGFGGPSVTLTNGMVATNLNLSLTNGGPNIITGSVLNSSNTNGIPGLMLLLQSGKLIEVAFTDTNGNYSASVPAGFWSIQPVKERLARRAYVLPDAKFQVDATGGNVTNANILLPPGTAMFYGTVMDNSNHPFANVELDSTIGGNVQNSYSVKGYTDPNGNYSTVTLGDMTNQWACDVDSGDYGSNIRNYIMNYNTTTNFSPGKAVRNDFVGLPATAVVSGHVQDNGGTNVVGVTLMGNASIGGKNYTTLDATTDNSGNYVMTLADGQWQIQFLTGGFSDDIDAHGYEDITGPHIVDVPPANQVLNFIVYPLGTPAFASPGFISQGDFGFNVYGALNVSYTLQASSTLAPNSWTNVYSFIITNSPMFISDPTAASNPRFYRLMKTP